MLRSLGSSMVMVSILFFGLSLFAETKPIEKLGSDDWQTRMAEMKRIAGGGSEVTEELLEALRSEDLEVSSRARHALLSRALNGNRATFERIVASIQDEGEVREQFKEKRRGLLQKRLKESGAHITPIHLQGRKGLGVEIRSGFTGRMDWLAEFISSEVDSFRVYDKVLSPEVISSLYRSDRLSVVSLFNVGLSMEEVECFLESEKFSYFLWNDSTIRFSRSRSPKTGIRDTVYVAKSFQGDVRDILGENTYDVQITGYSLSKNEAEHIAQLKQIRFLRLSGTGLTGSDVEKLRKTLKGVALVYRKGGFLGYKTNGFVGNESRVIGVLADSPAFQAGLRPGDVITHLDGKKMSRYALLSEIPRLDPGSKVVLTVERPDKVEKIEVVLGIVTGELEQYGYW